MNLQVQKPKKESLEASLSESALELALTQTELASLAEAGTFRGLLGVKKRLVLFSGFWGFRAKRPDLARKITGGWFLPWAVGGD